jgi:hypothetical protein
MPTLFAQQPLGTNPYKTNVVKTATHAKIKFAEDADMVKRDQHNECENGKDHRQNTALLHFEGNGIGVE